jgi:hypothetical protein
MESLVVSAFVTILFIYLSQFVPPTNLTHVDTFVAHIKSNKAKMPHAVAFSVAVAFVTDYILLLSLD